jgi:ABC-2 type transport system permease protein
MERGDASALVVLPKGLGDALLEGRAVRVVVVKNPSQQIVPQMVEQVVGVLGEAAFYVHELAGEELKSLRGREMDDAGIGALSTRLSRVIRAASGWNRLELKTEEIKAKQAEATGGVGASVMPGMLILALLFAASGLASDWWKEKQAWTLRRAMSTPAGLGPVVAGKVMSYSAVVTMLAVTGLGLGHWLLAMPVARPALAGAWLVVSGVVMFLVLTLLQTAASTRRTAEMASNLVVMPLMLAGGSLLPFEMMPPSMAAIARWTPNGAALVVLRRLLEGAPGPVALPFVVALAAAALLGWACARRVSGRFAL